MYSSRIIHILFKNWLVACSFRMPGKGRMEAQNAGKKRALWPYIVSALVFLAIVGTAAALLAPEYVAGSMRVAALELSGGKAVLGESLTARVTLENKGLFPINGHIPLSVDNLLSNTIASLDGRSRKTYDIVISADSVGEHVVSAGALTSEFRILKPATFVLSDLSASPETIIRDKDMTISVHVANTGEVAGRNDAIFNVYGKDLDAIPVELGPGEERTIEQKIVAISGNVKVEIGDLSQTFRAYKEASISVSELKLSKDFVMPNEKATLSVLLENSGELPGSYLLEITENGKPFASQNVSIDGNETKEFKFDVSGPKPGYYEFKAGKITKKLCAVTVSRPKNGTYIVGKRDLYLTDLVVINNYNKDVIIVVCSSSGFFTSSYVPKTLDIVYVRAKSRCNIQDIDSMYYTVYYSVGSNYSKEKRGFVTDVIYAEFDSVFYTLDFQFNSYKWTITLNPSKQGNAQVSSMDESDFPK